MKDKKVKIYYLTDKGIDLFPVMYEMFYWSMRNFKTGFLLPEAIFNFKGEGMSSDQIINEAQKKYLRIRSSILN